MPKDAEFFYTVLKKGTGEDRGALLAGLREAGLAAEVEDRVAKMVHSELPEDVIEGFALVALQLSIGKNPEVGAGLTLALHRFAADRFHEKSGVPVTGLVTLANQYLDACARMGDLAAELAFANDWADFYRQREHEWLTKRVTSVGHQPPPHPLRTLSNRLRALRRPSDIKSETLGVAIDEFELGTGSPRKAARPPGFQALPELRIVSTGLADYASPGQSLEAKRALIPAAQYWYWLEIGKQAVAGSLDTSVLPDQVPADATLTVALFDPDDAFGVQGRIGTGRLQLHAGGRALVVQQPGRNHENVPKKLLERRLLFQLTAPEKHGRYRLRSSIYHAGIVVESRLIELHVGEQPAAGRPAVWSNIDYTLSSSLDPIRLKDMEQHQLSITLNDDGRGNHDFYFFSDQKRTVQRSVTISGHTLDGLIKQARRALREITWGDDQEYSAGKPYRYHQPRSIDDLSADLARLAARGADIYNSVIPNLADDEEELSKILATSGLLQIAGSEDIRFVLPAGLIYDYDFDNQARRFEDYDLCPTFAEALAQRRPLQDTACFRGACPVRNSFTSVCPSGFWGFRHAIGLPISMGRDGAGDVATRIRYDTVPAIVVAVSTAPDLQGRLSHQRELQALHEKWATQSWTLAETRESVLTSLSERKPHLVYFYCHGGVTTANGSTTPYLSVGAPHEGPIVAQNVGARVRWIDPRPLVFINGCHTTALDADSALDFVTSLVRRSRACGVIGTEITVFESLAGAFALSFWRILLRGEVPVGEAVRHARLELLQAGNPLGLVYTPFVFAGTRVERNT